MVGGPEQHHPVEDEEVVDRTGLECVQSRRGNREPDFGFPARNRAVTAVATVATVAAVATIAAVAAGTTGQSGRRAGTETRENLSSVELHVITAVVFLCHGFSPRWRCLSIGTPWV